MNDNPRAKRLADRIKVIVAQLLDTRIKDPRLGFVTVTDVRVTGDLQQASVFYTVYGSDEERAGTAAALESAKGLIRSEVGKQTGVRLTPTIDFHLDTVPETSAHLTAALDEARRRDAELASLRAGKSYAGDADPYRRPHEEEETDMSEPQFDETAGFAGYDDAEPNTQPGAGAVIEKLDDAAGFAGYDDER
jgi:ribosome-binding factor A